MCGGTIQLKDLIRDVTSMFANPVLATEYLNLIREIKGRYLGDQVQVIKEAITGRSKDVVNTVLEKCVAGRYL
jgi:hypothetical protein